jgi:iron complex outermembrane receptor protein
MSKTSSLTLNRVNKLGNNQPNLLTNKLSFAIKSVLLSSTLGLATLPTTVLAESYTANMAENNAAQAAVITFTIKPATLDAVLKQFGQSAGINLSYQADAVRKVNSKGLQGRYAIAAGLQKILVDSGFKATKTSNGYSVSAADGARIGTLAIAVVTSEDLNDGSAADGYRTDEITAVGPWRGRTLKETPYSINVVSGSLIENLQATNPEQVYKIIPVIQLNHPQGSGTSYATMRGFQNQTVAHNGISSEKWSYAQDIVMEQTAQIEVLTGLSGFFYGSSGIGGTINYVSKKPTDERLNKLTFGNTTGSNLYLHGDFGGQFDENGTFGYRLNVVTQDGDTHVDHRSLQRNSLALVLDWQVNNDLLIAVNASKRDWQLDGEQAYWSMGDISRPAAKDIDANKFWSQKWTNIELNSQRLGTTIDWAINEHINWRSAYTTAESKRPQMINVSNMLQSNTSYDQWQDNFAPFIYICSGGFCYLDMNFNTSDIEHTLTAGWRFSKGPQQKHEETFVASFYVENLSTEKPTYITEPDWGNPDLGAFEVRNKHASQNFIIGDDIRFNEQWSALVGVSLVEVSFTNSGKDDYKENAVTPNLSLIYQPLDNITTYASYSEGFELGGIAVDSYQSATNNVVNAGEAMRPLTSSQIELGAKIDFNGMLLTAALFEIDKGLEYYNAVNNKQYEFVQDGRQVHRGLEFTATGKLTENLSLVGGFTLLDAQVKENKANPEMEGRRPRNVAKEMFKLYGEYNITAIPGLLINGGFNHTGSSYGNKMNNDKIAAYTLVDIGARYNLNLVNKEVTLRLNINNVTDEQYWVTSNYLGERRTVSMSASVNF